jgi:hypothetical protein
MVLYLLYYGQRKHWYLNTSDSQIFIFLQPNFWVTKGTFGIAVQKIG